MQTGGRCGDRAFVFCIHGLIALSIIGFGIALHVGRQRQLARFAHQRFEIAALQFDNEETILAGCDQSFHAIGNRDLSARFRRVACTQLRERSCGREQSFDQ